jgi:hypothetical protein
MKLAEVVPWGRTCAEYRAMFSLTDDFIGRRIVDCAAGPSSFTAEWTAARGDVTACDPLYAFDAESIRGRFEATVDTVMDQVRARLDSWSWSFHRDADALLAARRRALSLFSEDFAAAPSAKRYVAASLPELPFASQSFDLALCSHFLFLYSEPLGADFHAASVRELCRIAKEVRIFPLLTNEQVRSPHVDAARALADALGLASFVQQVPYELQRGGNEMLVIRARLPGN